MRLPKRKETLKAYAARTGLPMELVLEYQSVRNAQRREARKLFNRLGIEVTYGVLMPDIRTYTRGGDVGFFKSAALSGSSWLGDIRELYAAHAYGYLANLYQLTSEYAPDADSFSVIGDIIKRQDVDEMLMFIDAIGSDAIKVVYKAPTKKTDEDEPDETEVTEPGESLDFSELRRGINEWISGHGRL